ncbi:RNA polymerase sigma factor [Pirellulaceae bacterium SH449]
MESSNATRNSLLASARSQSADAWEQLVHIYTPLLHAWARRLGCDSHEADDLSQDVFQAAARSLDTFRGDGVTGSFRGWLWKITYRKWVDRYRRERGEASAVGGSTAARSLEQIADAPAEPSTSDLLNTTLRRATSMVRNEFQDTHWQAFWRSVIEGESTESVSERLGMTPASVRQARSRILRRLRAIMGDLG